MNMAIACPIVLLGTAVIPKAGKIVSKSIPTQITIRAHKSRMPTVFLRFLSVCLISQITIANIRRAITTE